jgi:hypothetical protein
LKTQKRIFNLAYVSFVPSCPKNLKKKCNVKLKTKENILKHFGHKGKSESFFEKKNKKNRFGHVQNKKMGVTLGKKLSFFPSFQKNIKIQVTFFIFFNK